MKQNLSLNIFRFFEKVGLASLLGGLMFLVWWYFVSGAVLSRGVVTAMAVVLIGFGLYIYTSNKIKTKIELLTSQNNFSTDSQFMALFERSPVPYIIIDSEGRINKTNQAAVNLLRVEVDNIINTDLLTRFISSDDSDVSIIVNKVKSGVSLNEVEVELQLDDEKTIWVLLSSYPSQQSGQIFISLVDITQAKKVDIAKSEFLALATHQLGTPLAAIRWNAELLGKHIPEELQETVGGYVKKVQNNTVRMSALIDDFLNVSKLELGTFGTESQNINLNSFVNSIVDELSQKLEEKNINLHRDELPEDFSINIDKRLLDIVVSNLLSNATKYVNESGNVWLTTSTEANSLCIQISDDGIGIPESEVKNLFTKFFRASNATKHHAEGTGLGLYVVKQAVELMGGSIRVDSNGEKVTSFKVMIPLS